MLLIKKKPVTPSERHTVLLDRSDLSKGKPLKEKTISFKNKAGRNNQGKITVYTKGGGHKYYLHCLAQACCVRSPSAKNS